MSQRMLNHKKINLEYICTLDLYNTTYRYLSFLGPDTTIVFLDLDAVI
jgi:hypothetical protein